MSSISCKIGDVDEKLDQFNIFGRFQTVQYVLINLPILFVAMMNVNYVFVAENVDHRCRIPECDSSNASLELPTWWPQNIDSKCARPVINYTQYDEENRTCRSSVFTLEIENCNEFIYENDNSFVAELNLGCQTWKANLVGTIHNAGMMISMLLMGYISDRFGRKSSLIFCSVAGCIGILKAVVRNYSAYLVIELLESILSAGIYTTGFVLMIEMVGESKRVATGVIFSGVVYLGETIFALFATGLQDWKKLILVTYVPVLAFIAYFFVLKESVRWQMTRGKIDEAKENLKTIAKVNKLEITSEEINDIDNDILLSKFNVDVQVEKETIVDMIKSKEIMKRLAVICICFFTACWVYFSLAIHSVLLPGNKYTNFILSSLLSFPGDLLTLVTFDRFGRRISLQMAYLLCAICLIGHAYTPESLAWLKIFLFLIGKLSIALCFTGIYTYGVELSPTSVRTSIVGCGNMVGRFGGMLSPLTPLLAPIYDPLPSLIFASASLIASGFLYFTPETKDLPMFDTIAQAEAYKKKMGVNKPE